MIYKLKQLLIIISVLFIVACNNKHVEHYSNGQIKSISPNSSPKSDGFTLNYYENGNLKSIGKYINKKEQGSFLFYYENGIIKRQEIYINGALDGLIKNFHENGEIESLTYYLNNKKEGNQFFFFKNGLLKAYLIYKSDKAVSNQMYNEKGELIYYANSSGLIYSTHKKGGW